MNSLEHGMAAVQHGCNMRESTCSDLAFLIETALLAVRDRLRAVGFVTSRRVLVLAPAVIR